MILLALFTSNRAFPLQSLLWVSSIHFIGVKVENEILCADVLSEAKEKTCFYNGKESMTTILTTGWQEMCHINYVSIGLYTSDFSLLSQFCFTLILVFELSKKAANCDGHNSHEERPFHCKREGMVFIACIPTKNNVSIAKQGWQRCMGICIVLCQRVMTCTSSILISAVAFFVSLVLSEFAQGVEQVMMFCCATKQSKNCEKHSVQTLK